MIQISDILENAPCPLCGSEEHSIQHKAKDLYNNFDGNFYTSKCTNCGFIYTNPRPSKDNIDKLYPDDAGYLVPKDVQKVPNKIQSVLKRKNGYNHLKINPCKLCNPLLIRKIKIQSFPNYIENGKLLDIGASYGDYMYKMQSLGWNVKGIELNQNSVNHANDKLHLDVRKELIEDFNPNQKFDVVHMGMVLEHIINPKEVLEKIKTILAPEGTFIFSIPNVSGFESKLFGQYWYSLHLPMHLNHFSPKTICALLKSIGAKEIKIFHQNDTNDTIKSLGYLASERKIFKPIHKFIKIKAIRKLCIQPLIWIFAYLKITSRITVYVKY